MDNEHKKKVLRYAELAMQSNAKPLSDEEEKELKEIAATLLREQGLGHAEILQRAAENVLDKF